MVPLFAALSHRAVIQLSGSDKVAFLQGLVTNDVTKAGPECLVYAALLTPQGKFLHDLFIFERDGDWWIDCERDRASDLIKRLSLYRLRCDVQLFDASQDYAVYVGWGGYSHGITDPRLPEMGTRIYLPAHEIPPFPLAPLEAYDSHRLALGIPDGSRDIPIEKGIILECGFDELGAIDWDKGCYLGQELTARTRYRGLVRKRLLPVKIDGEAPPPGIPVFLGDDPVGEMRSATADYGLALLRLATIRQTLPVLTAGQNRLIPFVPGWMKLPQEE
ncbi:MAG: folate-binding protein [Alphaproteobacteria bacterium]|nr:folate-binding protein [Alphaproteobacteria bacterium]